MTDKQARRVLVIDDNEAVLSMVTLALSGAGYDVIGTQQTVGAARHLKSCDLVIVDYHMPGLHGGDVVRSLRAAATAMNSSPAFYLYTSDTALEGTPKALGFDGAFTRKGDCQWLLQQIDAAFRLRALIARTKGSSPSQR